MRWGLGAANGKMTVGLWVVWEGVLGSFSEKTAWVLCGDSRDFILDSLAGTKKKRLARVFSLRTGTLFTIKGECIPVGPKSILRSQMMYIVRMVILPPRP